MVLEGPQHEGGEAKLREHVRGGEGDPTCMKRLWNGSGEEQVEEHQGKQQQAHQHVVRVQPIGGPHRVDPDPPHREEQDQGFHGTDQGELRNQRMGQLGYGEHEDQVKEEFDKRRSAEFMVPSVTEEVGMVVEHAGIL